MDIKDFLIDVENRNFMPIENSILIDGGTLYDNLDINYNGDNPDIGAYESGGENWTPGITWNLEQEFGNEFSFPDNLINDLGDLNTDDIVNILDVMILIDMILNSIYNENGDMNNDGGLNISDIILLVNIILRS